MYIVTNRSATDIFSSFTGTTWNCRVAHLSLNEAIKKFLVDAKSAEVSWVGEGVDAICYILQSNGITPVPNVNTLQNKAVVLSVLDEYNVLAIRITGVEESIRKPINPVN